MGQGRIGGWVGRVGMSDKGGVGYVGRWMKIRVLYGRIR